MPERPLKAEGDFLVRRGCNRHGVDIDPATFAVEADGAVHEGENRVIAAQADVLARHEPGAALADDDVAGDDDLRAKFLHAEAFADAVASVFDGSLTFFMSHTEKGVGVE